MGVGGAGERGGGIMETIVLDQQSKKIIKKNQKTLGLGHYQKCSNQANYKKKKPWRILITITSHKANEK